MRVDGESAEAVAEVLERFGHQGVSLEQDGIPPDVWDESEVPPPQNLTIRAYFPVDERLEATKNQLEAALGHMRLMYPMPTPAYRKLQADDWAEAWKAHYKPLRIGERLVVRPLWIEVELASDDIEIALDPGMAFGTGTHPTTQLCLEALEGLIEPAQDVLDLGSGSGILSIAAAKLGAGRVLALDIDEIAVACYPGECAGKWREPQDHRRARQPRKRAELRPPLRSGHRQYIGADNHRIDWAAAGRDCATGWQSNLQWHH